MAARPEKPLINRPSGGSLREVSDLVLPELRKRSGFGGKGLFISLAIHLGAALIACAIMLTGGPTGQEEGSPSADDGFAFEASPNHGEFSDHSKPVRMANPIPPPTPEVPRVVAFPALAPSPVSLPMQPASLSHSPLTADFSAARQKQKSSASKSTSPGKSRSTSVGRSGMGTERSTTRSKPPPPPPKLLSAPPPRYPAKAKAAGITGKTAVLVRVNSSGSAESTSLYHSSGNPELDEAAVTAARKWKFSPSPGLDERETISVIVHVTFAL